MTNELLADLERLAAEYDESHEQLQAQYPDSPINDLMGLAADDLRKVIEKHREAS